MLYKQLLAGCEEANTEYIGIAEHDCFYTEDHLSYIPPSDDKFYYNENVWFVSLDKGKRPQKYGMYSRYWEPERLALSQMVSNRELYIKALRGRIDAIRKDKSFAKKIDHINEPGKSKIKSLYERATSGRPSYLRPLLPDFMEIEQYNTFNDVIPQLDVRHGGNFTGPRNGSKLWSDVPYWGKFEDFMRRWV